MKQYVLLLLVFIYAHGAPTMYKDTSVSSCQDTLAHAAAAQAMDKINLERHEGYVFSLESLSNVHQMHHGETGVVFYLTINVLETNCHVLSKKNLRNCDVRTIGEHPIYGQCRAVIYINRVHRVSRLYKYSCAVRPVPVSKIVMMCPDCSVLFPVDHKEIQKTMQMGMEKFNREKSLDNYFSLLNITRATSQGEFVIFYNVEFTIIETVCNSNTTDIADVSKCDLMACEFAHKGFCKASRSLSNGNEYLNVECEIFEPEAAEAEKKRHLLGGELDHSHSNVANMSLDHDHTHNHMHFQSHLHQHNHHHTHKHNESHSHSNSHVHSHGHGHDHVHMHHAKAHNHTHGPGFHHNYSNSDGETHEHDHDLALDHEHLHAHLHEHEHHHHHHEHQHEDAKRRPEGVMYVLPSMDKHMTLPFHPDQPVADSAVLSTLAFHPDPEVPGLQEPTIEPFPTTLSKECPADFKTENKLIKNVFAEDPLFKDALACEKPVIKLSMFAQCN